MRPATPALAAAILFAAAPAFAHAFLQSAAPQVGSTVSAAPREVRVTFSEAVEPAFSKVTVSGPPGFGGTGPVTSEDGARTLAVPLRRPLPPGDYVVSWRVVSTDSHTTQGTFHFELKP